MSNVSTNDTVIEGRYSNYFKVGFNAYEFLFDYGQKHDATEPRIQSRVIMTPVFAKSLAEMLSSSLEAYELEFGEITAPGEGR